MSQKRFLLNETNKSPAATGETNTLWKVPIDIVSESCCPNVHMQVLLEKETNEVNIGNCGAGWIKLNKNMESFYRTNYSSEMLDKLAILIKEQKLTTSDRLGLQNDLFALVNINMNCIFFCFIVFFNSFFSIIVNIRLSESITVA